MLFNDSSRLFSQFARSPLHRLPPIQRQSAQAKVDPAHGFGVAHYEAGLGAHRHQLAASPGYLLRKRT